jgi:HPt (histidine-containing phosphotransfer) domain-containing protein
MLDPKGSWGLLKEAEGEWLEDKAPRLGAALAYYSALSIAPLLIIALFIAGVVFGQEVAQGYLLGQIRSLVSVQGGEAIETMIAHANQPRTGTLAAILGVITLLAGAAGVVGQLQDALNTIWEVAPKPGRGVDGFLKDHFLKSVPLRWERLEEAIGARDGRQVSWVAHGLKGAFLTVGAEALAAACQELMTHGERGDFAAIETVSRPIRTQWERLVEEARRYLDRLPVPDTGMER